MNRLVIGHADGSIPVVVTRCEIATFRCRIPVLPGSDGALTEPLERRTDRCNRHTSLLVGRAPTCPKHITDMLTLLGNNRAPCAELDSWLTVAS